MIISSDAFMHNEVIPEDYTCDGVNVSPPIEFEEVPSAAKSIVLIVDDPDAPTGDWVHWVVWNIPTDIEKIPEGFAPEQCVEGRNDFGTNQYGGPCPPSGEHRYYFKAYALDTLLDLPIETEKSGLLEAMEGHVIEQAEIVGRYARI